MAEWSKALDLKSNVETRVGSNPAADAFLVWRCFCCVWLSAVSVLLFDSSKFHKHRGVMKILYETPIGYLLIAEAAEKTYTLEASAKFVDVQEMLDNFASLQRGVLPDMLKTFLEKHVADGPLCVTDESVGKLIEDTTSIRCTLNCDAARAVRERLAELVGVTKEEYYAKVVHLAHKMGGMALKENPEKMDVMVVESINLLEDLDRDINMHAMRLKEWYGFHFPELEEVCENNIDYMRTIVAVGNRRNIECIRSEGIFGEDKTEEVIERARTSMGAEITDEDCTKITSDAKSVIRMCTYRDELSKYLRKRVTALAPNLVALVGEMTAARMLAKAGSLLALSKMPASTLQIMGAEKAFLSAIKNKSDTPKHGLIYHSPLVTQASPSLKGKMARSLASKASLACKIDAFGESTSSEMGTEARVRLEKRLQKMEEAGSKKKVHARRPKHHFKPVLKYDERQDIRESTKKQKTTE